MAGTHSRDLQSSGSAQPRSAAELFQFVGGTEPAALRAQYLATPDASRILHAGTTVPNLAVPHVRRKGLWVPASTPLEKSPIDHMDRFMTGEELFGSRETLDLVRDLLAGHSREDILRTCAIALAAITGDRDAEGEEARAFANRLRPHFRVRAHHLLDEGRVVFTREALLALAKLGIVHGADTTSSEYPMETMIPVMLLTLHDVFGDLSPDMQQPAPGVFSDALVSWMAANQLLHRSVERESLLTAFEARWNDMSRASTKEVADAFAAAMGFSILDQAAVALAIWSGALKPGAFIFERSWLAPLKLSDEVLDRILRTSAISLEEAAARIAGNELADGQLNWKMDTFEQFPIIRLDGTRYLLLDAGLLLQKALGWAPLYVMEEHTSRTKMKRLQARMASATEDYIYAILESCYAQNPPSRLFHERALQRMNPHKRCADAAVDFGGRWAVIEVTARRVPRSAIHGDPRGAQPLIEMVLDELRQVASTAKLLQTRRDLFTGESAGGPVKIYPLVIMAEGFPTNPVVLTEIRRRAQEEQLLTGIETAPIEVFDLVELEILEGIVQEGGPSLPTLIDRKAESSFWADSFRNFVLASGYLKEPLPERVREGFSVPLLRVAAGLKSDADEDPENAAAS